ncbi:amidinotransferase [Rhodomicrobium sp. Az07]|nr:amidinotransferase [Rhodomicrobium sp. Az07]
MPKTPTFLMTDDSHFEVSYKINPWMTPEEWRRDEVKNRAEARHAAASLAEALRQTGARVVHIDGAPGLPDMVFPANAAVVLDRRVMAARFRYPERQGEERHFLEAFARLKDEGTFEDVSQMPKGYWQEGAGDAIFDVNRQFFWTGFGPRSSHEAGDVLRDFFNVPVKPLELVSGRFYHLDTCFVPLSGGEVLYYPKAFSKASLSVIRDHVAADKRIEASDEDAARFAVNAVNIGRDIVMAEPTARLADELRERGYSVVPLKLRPFIMSGGGAYCMTLRLDLKSASATTNRGETP